MLNPDDKNKLIEIFLTEDLFLDPLHLKDFVKQLSFKVAYDPYPEYYARKMLDACLANRALHEFLRLLQDLNERSLLTKLYEYLDGKDIFPIKFKALIEIQTLLSTVKFEQENLKAYYQQCLPQYSLYDSPQEITSLPGDPLVIRLTDKLSNYPATDNTHPFISFVSLCRNDLTQEMVEKIDGLLSTLARQTASDSLSEEETASVNAARLLIKVAPSKGDDYKLDAWLFKEENIITIEKKTKLQLTSNRKVSNEHIYLLHEKIKTILKNCYPHLNAQTELKLELMLPVKYYNLIHQHKTDNPECKLPHQWEIEVGKVTRVSLGATYPLALRFWDRHYDPAYRQGPSLHLWHKKWQARPCKSVSNNQVTWVEKSQDYNKGLSASLSEAVAIFIGLTLATPATLDFENMLYAMLDTGVPFALFSNSGPAFKSMISEELLRHGSDNLVRKVKELSNRDINKESPWHDLVVMEDSSQDKPPDLDYFLNVPA